MSLYEPPLSQIVAGALALAGGVAAAVGARLLARGIRSARSLDVVRAIRAGAVALAAGCFALGLLLEQSGLVVLGAIILGEELYETGVLALIIRLGERGSAHGTG